MTFRYITANQSGLSTAHGDNTFVAAGVTISGSIDMAGDNGGDQTVTVHGTLFGSVSDYYGSSSGGDQIFIGAGGAVNADEYGAIQLGGGGHAVVNAGTLSSMTSGSAIFVESRVAAQQDERNVITNTGTISGMSLDPTRAFNAASVKVNSAAGSTINNSGDILSTTGYAIALFGAGNDVVVNTGHIQGGVFLDAGNDVFDGRLGHVSGPVIGYDGNDTLRGGAGDDTLVGGRGNDTYYVNDSGDVVDEGNSFWGGAGNDTILASFSFELAGDQVSGRIETLRLTGSADVDGSGTAGAEVIVGNAGDNRLSGLGGTDTLRGAGGDDRLAGGNLADNLDGGTGEDRLYGRGGNDTLNGGADDDSMYGGAGNDSYVVDSLDDIVNEALAGSGGTDTVRTGIGVNLSDTVRFKGAIENLTLTGSATSNATGNSLPNTIIGNSAANVLDGRGGNDKLTGGGGADQFRFTTTPHATTNKDTVRDFVHGVDEIVLENAVFSSLTRTGALASANFAINTPKDANDFVVYNTSTGALHYDTNGNGSGGAVQIAVLSGVPGLTQADFYII